MAHHDLIINHNDHLIVFISNRKIISDIEKMFTVSAEFSELLGNGGNFLSTP